MSGTSSAPDGCASSWQLDLFATGTSMTATSAMSPRAISRATRSATSLRALDSGHSLFAGPDGATTSPSGPDPAHASLSARQAAAMGLVTSDISGRRGTGSSASARLSRSLASRYQARTARLGSTLYRLTWRHAATPAGRWLSVQQASGLRTSDSGSTGLLTGGWPTPTAAQRHETANDEEMAKRLAFRAQSGRTTVPLYLEETAQLVGWPTPTEGDANSSGSRSLPASQAHPGLSLTDAARMTGWPTPRANDSPNVSAIEVEKIMRGERTASSTGNSRLELTAHMAGWATPHESDHRPGHPSRMHDTSRINLNDQAMLTGWPTPTGSDDGGARPPDPKRGPAPGLVAAAATVGWATPANRDYRTPNHQRYADRGGGPKGEQLNNQVAHQIPGASLNGSPASTAGRGLLNPEFSRWLQGVPATWPGCAPTATRSTRTSRPRS
jgi:hypothetical protein